MSVMAKNQTPLQKQQQQQQIGRRPEDLAFFRKCGTITADPDLNAFGLSCHFCPGVCLQFEVFLQHLREVHSQDIKDRYLKDKDIIKSDNHKITEKSTQTEIHEENEKKEEARPLVDSSMDNSNSNWNEITLMNGNENENAEGLVGVEMGPPREAVGLVYIIESATMQGELLAEADVENDDAKQETCVDSFEMFNGNRKRNNNNKDSVSDSCSRVGDVEAGMMVSAAVKEGHEVIKEKKTKKGLKNHADNHNEQYEKPRTRMQTNAIAAKSTPKEGDINTPTVREEEHTNREIVSYLLEAYKKNAKLWNPNNPQYKYNANRKIFNELSAPLERDMKYKLSGSEIFTIIKGLRSRYRRELTKSKAQRKGKYKSRLWYYDKMDFLRNIIESKRAERAARDRLDYCSDDSENSTSSMCEQQQTTVAPAANSLQNKAVLSFLLAKFKEQERLWNPQHPCYKNSNKNEHYDRIADQLREKMNISVSGEECFAAINKLRMRYRNELTMLNKRKGMHIPKLWCFEQMDFLGKILEERLRKRKAVIESQPRSAYLKAKPIAFTSEQDQFDFIGIYRNYSALWDVDHPDYRSATYRNTALVQMLEEVNETFQIDACLDQLQKTLYQMRKDFSEDKLILLQNSGSLLHQKRTHPASPIYALLAEFLDINLGPFRCEFCDEIIKTSDQYKIHLSAHDGTQPFICTLCGKGFQIPGNLAIHIRRHKRDFPYACGECDKCFATSSEAANHKRSHTGERPFICDLCGKSFKTWSFFDIHRRSTHLKESQFHCPICDKDFYERNRYTDHMNRHLNIRKHLCAECGKSYTTYANLQKHMEIHSPVKKYKCTLCSKRFAQYPSLRWHKRKVHEQAQEMEQ